MKIKYTIVTDGEFWAVKRKQWWLTTFLDLEAWPVCFWWGRDSEYFKDCWSTKDKAEKSLAHYILRYSA